MGKLLNEGVGKTGEVGEEDFRADVHRTQLAENPVALFLAESQVGGMSLQEVQQACPRAGGGSNLNPKDARLLRSARNDIPDT